MSRNGRIGAVIAIAAFLVGVLVSSFFVPAAYIEVCEHGAEDGQESCYVQHASLFFAIKAAELFNYLSPAIVAMATGAIGLFTYYLYKATSGMWAHTRTVERAYLAVEALGIRPFESIDKVDHAVAHLSVRNVGHLPARHVRWFIDAELSSDGKRADFPIDENLFYGDNVIPPGTEMKRSKNCAFSEQDIANFLGGGLYLYVWGKVRYFDGFKPGRSTRFCHRYDRRGIRIDEKGLYKGHRMLGQSSMRYHQFGNDAD